MRYLLFMLGLAGMIVCSASFSIRAQSRDYFTESEVEVIRDAQDIDLRILVLTHIIDRRFAILKIDAGSDTPAGTKQKKDEDKWGPPPTGTRLEMLSDVQHVLQKAIDDIDDTAAHVGTKMEREIENPVRSKKEKTEPPLNRALKYLANAAQRYKPVLAAELDKSKDQKEKGAILNSLDLCEQIIGAAAKPIK